MGGEREGERDKTPLPSVQVTAPPDRHSFSQSFLKRVYLTVWHQVDAVPVTVRVMQAVPSSWTQLLRKRTKQTAYCTESVSVVVSHYLHISVNMKRRDSDSLFKAQS